MPAAQHFPTSSSIRCSDVTANPHGAAPAEPLVYPDPLFAPSLIDGAAFLYFEQPLLLTLAPAPVLAGGGFEMTDWVLERRPEWGPRFLFLEELWGQESDGCVSTLELLNPLVDRFKTVLIAVPGDLPALDRAGELIETAGFDRTQMRSIIDPVAAAGELMNHLFLEMWLTLSHDTEALYAYASELFSDTDRLERTLQRAYLLRLAHFPLTAPFDPLLINNPRLGPFLLALPGGENQGTEPEAGFGAGLASWEIFRQLLRPYLEPLNAQSVGLIADCLRDREDEIAALKQQTERLGERIALPDAPEKLIDEVENFIRLHVADEIVELLRLNADAKQRFLDSLLSDRAAWAAAVATAHGAAAGSVEWTMGGAIGAIATVASKGYASFAERRRQLRRSEYRLIYMLRR
jgi:hypothetical protein